MLIDKEYPLEKRVSNRIITLAKEAITNTARQNAILSM
jgi:hypothetical protein